MMESGASPVKCSARGASALASLAALVLTLSAAPARAAEPAADSGVSDPPACQLVRLSDIGWTDVTATTAIVSALVRDLGYRARRSPCCRCR
jgi:ABC-type proline/glycine betaine transport system substrate-binding protein